MGAGRTQKNDLMILSIKGGTFARKVDDTREGEGIRKRQAFNPSTQETITVTEEYFDFVSGYIKQAYLKEFDGRRFLNMIIDDVMISLKYDNSRGGIDAYCQDLIKRLPNIDLSKKVTLKPFKFLDEKRSAAKGREVFNTGISVYQDEKVTYKFTKEEPNGIPQPVKKTVNGKDVWDFSQVDDFLYSVLTEFLLNFEDEFKQPEQQKPEQETDDLPF